MNRLFINIDAQDAQDFFRRRLACVPGHPQIRTRSLPESASPAAASRPDYPVHPVHRCSIYSPSRWICPVAGGGRPARRQTGVSQRGQAGFQRNRLPDTPHLTIGTTPPGARASRPHAVPSVAAQFPCDVAADRPAGENPSVLVPETKPVSPSFDPHRRGGTGGRLNTCVAAAEPAQERYIMGAGLARKG